MVGGCCFGKFRMDSAWRLCWAMCLVLVSCYFAPLGSEMRCRTYHSSSPIPRTILSERIQQYNRDKEKVCIDYSTRRSQKIKNEREKEKVMRS